jgi:hypothetical protein
MWHDRPVRTPIGPFLVAATLTLAACGGTTEDAGDDDGDDAGDDDDDDGDDEAIVNGDQIDASNTGFTAYVDPALGRALTLDDLVDDAGGTFATDGEVIERRRFTSTVTITGDDVTLRGCLFDLGAGGENDRALVVSGEASGFHLDHTTITADAGSSIYHGVLIDGAAATRLTRNDISRGENNIEDDGDDTVIEYNFVHDSSNDDNPAGHRDAIEIYGGDRHTLRFNRLTHPAGETAVINVAPWAGDASVEGLVLTDNFLDGGNMHTLVDDQAGGVRGVSVLRNKLGGHTNPGYGPYRALNNHDGRAIVGTADELAADPEAIHWPTEGDDVNRWSDCADLEPDRTGEVVEP